jgi:hypothetical protein
MRFHYDGKGNCAEVSNITVGISNNSIATVKFGQQSPTYIVDVNELKHTLKEMQNEWFGSKNSARMVAGGVFFPIFMQYLFPWFLDAAKVYFVVKVCMAFYQENRGQTGHGVGGRTGYQAFIHYGWWFLLFSILPWGVELVSEIGSYMHKELMQNGIKIQTQ